MARRTFACFLLLLGGLWAQEETPWRSLFDGESLKGWTTVGVGQFVVQEGRIEGRSSKKSFLVSDEVFQDFEFEASVWVDPGANSGIQFRSRVTDKGRIVGYQAEVDPSERRWAGGIYDEGRRAWIAPLTGRPEAQAAYKGDTWNRYRIRCVGDHLQVWVNGVLTSDHRDTEDLSGHFALQHHGEKGKTVRFKDLRVRSLGRHAFVPIPAGRAGEGRPTEADWKPVRYTFNGSKADSEYHQIRLYPHEGIMPEATYRVRYTAKDAWCFVCPFGDPSAPWRTSTGGMSPRILLDDGTRAGTVLLQDQRLDLAAEGQRKKARKKGGDHEAVIAVRAQRLTVHLNGMLLFDKHPLAFTITTDGTPVLSVQGNPGGEFTLKSVERLLPQ